MKQLEYDSGYYVSEGYDSGGDPDVDLAMAKLRGAFSRQPQTKRPKGTREKRKRATRSRRMNRR